VLDRIPDASDLGEARQQHSVVVLCGAMDVGEHGEPVRTNGQWVARPRAIVNIDDPLSRNDLFERNGVFAVAYGEHGRLVELVHQIVERLGGSQANSSPQLGVELEQVESEIEPRLGAAHKAIGLERGEKSACGGPADADAASEFGGGSAAVIAQFDEDPQRLIDRLRLLRHGGEPIEPSSDYQTALPDYRTIEAKVSGLELVTPRRPETAVESIVGSEYALIPVEENERPRAVGRLGVRGPGFNREVPSVVWHGRRVTCRAQGGSLMASFSGATRSAPNVAVPLHALFEAVSDGVLITDAVGTRTYSNQAMKDLLGVDPAADRSSRTPEWLSEPHRDRYFDVIERTAQSEPGDEIVVLEWAIVDASGTERPIIARLFPVRGSNGGDSAAVLWLMQPVEPIPTEGPAEWGSALERIAAEVNRLGFGGTVRAVNLAHGYEGADRLTRRERDVVQCLLEGERVISIAERLDLSPHTVRNHLKSIFRKLDVHSQAELVKRVRG